MADLVSAARRRVARRRVSGRRVGSMGDVAPDDPDLALLLRTASRRVDGLLEGRLAGRWPGLALADVEVMRTVRGHPGGAADVAARLARAPQRASEVLAGLVREGLVDRGPSWRDGRSREHRLTEEGLDLLEDVDADLDGILRWELEGLGPHAREVLCLLLLVLAED